MLIDFDSSKMAIVDNDSPSDVEKAENEENRVGQIHGDKNGVFFWGGQGLEGIRKRERPKTGQSRLSNIDLPPVFP